jgi:endonuclease/exonuclease/phosphatase family metal-dependent hydrolase
MATTFKRLTKLFFVVLNVVAAVVFLLACLAPYLNPAQWWFISLLGLGYVFIVVTLIAFIFFWLVLKPKYVFISIIPLIIGWKGITVFFAFHVPGKFDIAKPDSVLRIVHWNVARFVEWRRNNNKGSQVRQKMMDLIREQNADVVCLQEFFTSTDPIYYDNLHYIIKELGYPYYYFSWDDDGDKQWVGQIIFSRLPILDSGLVRYPKPSQPESLLYVDVPFHKNTIRIYTTHLQSVRFKKRDYEEIESIKNRDTGLVNYSRNIFAKLRTGVIYRSKQTEVVKQVLASTPYPYILTGDFNDVPNSYTYYNIRGKQLQDVFLETGLGIGRTYTYIAPTLRIDYVFTTRNFQVLQFNRIIRNLSDHYMLVTDLQLKK